MSTRPTPLNWLSIATLGFVWGGTFMVIEIAIEGFTPLQVAAGRSLLGALTLLAVCAATGRSLPRLSDPRGGTIWLCAIAMGLLSTAVPFFLISWAQTRVSSAFAGVSMAMIPLVVLPLAHAFVPGERLTRRRLAGFGLGFAGTALLVGGGAFASTGAGGELWGRLACLLAVVSLASGAIITRLCPPTRVLPLAAASLLVSALLMVPVALLIDGWPGPSGAAPLAALTFLGIVPTALMIWLRTTVIRSAGPSFMTLTNYQVPVWSILFGALVLDEPIPVQLPAALALILAGLAVSQWRPRAPAA
ncbi:putative inner membrane transporter YedA [Pseudoruegeria aquimaris]|uniref:Putative inner membrane transporter YedA n=1 Tax=Pseudoruegeria aquimaris TaxID=393663 RepID=A0A1Y5S8N8_9RHOB|nr:EamA family transporter [Pseudoruegeria aquimaris]SLN34964.1 putative inner membrane transporter YedA [Pseudoruegeria aquimaris]